MPDDFAHLNTQSWFSFLRGGSSPRALLEAVAAHGQPGAALTDFMTVAGVVEFMGIAKELGLKAVIGATLQLEGLPSYPLTSSLVVLCRDHGGYANLNRMLSLAYARDRLTPQVSLHDLEQHSGGLIALAGGPGSALAALLSEQDDSLALAHLNWLRSVFTGRSLLVELVHHCWRGNGVRVRRLETFAREEGVPCVVTNAVGIATSADFAAWDLVNCIRLGVSVHDAHPERPVNDEPRIKSSAELLELIPNRVAVLNSLRVLECCELQLLRGEVNPPGAITPLGVTPRQHLRDLCALSLPARYGADLLEAAQRQCDLELAVIERWDLSDFFLVVHEVVQFARARRIFCYGRGSAANSIVAYLLGITAVCPLRHDLLFERFLNEGRSGTPDIDVDFASSRRLEVIAFLEARFGHDHTAMTATRQEYGLKGATRDTARALGFAIEDANRLSTALPGHARPHQIADLRDTLERLVPPSPLLEKLLETVPLLSGRTRHLGQHSGGMVLSREPLCHFTSTQPSANGVTQVVFDKDDVERLGLVKFDVLGLRMLDVIGGALEIIRRTSPLPVDVDNLDLEDASVYDYICRGETLALFQIESPGQIATLARHQPRDFGMLVIQVAILRPGPIQGGSIQPYLRRARGEEPVRYDHPSLEPALSDTLGVVVFQEQVLRITSDFAGMTLAESDQFRRFMSKCRDPAQMEALRSTFVDGALLTHPDLSLETAHRVFEQVASFAGYGFPKSHAAAFAKTVYISAWLKRYHPAAYMAAFFRYEPGMYPRITLLSEAQRLGVTVRSVCIVHSDAQIKLEPCGDGDAENTEQAIRLPLSDLLGVSEADAAIIELERRFQPFSGLEDVWRRVRVSPATLRALAEGGAFDLWDASRREVIWTLGVLEGQFGAPGEREHGELFDAPKVAAFDLAIFSALSKLETASWDLRQSGLTTAHHPMALMREDFARLGAVRIGDLGSAGRVTVAGLVIARQRPGNGKVVFLTLEDESGWMQCAVRLELWVAWRELLTRPAVVLDGALRSVGDHWRGLTVLRALDAGELADGAAGGLRGSPSPAAAKWR